LTPEQEDEIVASMQQLRSRRSAIQVDMRETYDRLQEQYSEMDGDVSADLVALLQTLNELDSELYREQEALQRWKLEHMKELRQSLVQRDGPEPRVKPIKPGEDPPVYRPFAMEHLREKTERVVGYHEDKQRVHEQLAIVHREAERDDLADEHERLAHGHRVQAAIEQELLRAVEVLYEAYYDAGQTLFISPDGSR
jgi:hypothetical protein